jgi:hypothetical protein
LFWFSQRCIPGLAKEDDDVIMKINRRVHAAYDESGLLVLIRIPHSPFLVSGMSQLATVTHAAKLRDVLFLMPFKT